MIVRGRHLLWHWVGDGERGSGTVLVLGVMGVVAVLAMVLAALGGAQGARGRAQAAADLGSLAAATSARYGVDGCATAADAVARNGAELVACTREGGGVVRVEVRCALGFGVLGAVLEDAQAQARAGPAP